MGIKDDLLYNSLKVPHVGFPPVRVHCIEVTCMVDEIIGLYLLCNSDPKDSILSCPEDVLLLEVTIVV